ncbi:hypothetical protein ABH972_004520 [Bradyrhizobium ottawaense]
MEIDERRKARGIATDDREHQRQVVMRSAHHRLRAAADADPGFKPAVLDRGIDQLIPQRRTQLALPAHRLLRQQGSKQVQLLLEQLFVFAQVETEQRKGFSERAAAEDHLGASVGERVQRGKALEDADGIVRRQHRYGRAEMDALGPRCDRGEHGLRRGDRKIGAVVFAEADEVEAEFVGQHRFVDDVADHLRVRKHGACGIPGDVAKSIQSELKRCGHR